MSYCKEVRYNVADLRFRVFIDPEDALAESFGEPYAPFLAKEEEAPHFTLRVSNERPEDNRLLNRTDEEPWETQGIFHEEELSMRIRRNREDASIEIAMQSIIEPTGWLLLTTDRKFETAHLTVKGSNAMRTYGINNALMLLYALRGAALERLLIHASVIRKDNFGYLFLGKSGTGKSTHSKLWLKNIPECSLLNDDNPVIGISETGEAFVSGSPWSGKTPCYKNDRVEIGAFVRLWQAPENHISRLSIVEAYAALLPTVSNMKWNPMVADGVSKTLEKILKQKGVFSLHCLPDNEAACLSYQTIRQA